MRASIIQIGITISLLLFCAFFMKSVSILAGTPEEHGVFIVQPSTSILRFQEMGHACGGRNGSWITGYVAFDGKRLSLSSATYSSPAEAKQKLHTFLESEAEIQEMGAKYDKEGQVVGERIVAFYMFEGKQRAIIMWTQDESAFVIETETLDCALEFERTRVK